MVKEVPEVAPMSTEPEIEECASDEMDRALNFPKSEVPLDDDDMLQVNSPPLWNLYKCTTVRCSSVLNTLFR